MEEASSHSHHHHHHAHHKVEGNNKPHRHLHTVAVEGKSKAYLKKEVAAGKWYKVVETEAAETEMGEVAKEVGKELAGMGCHTKNTLCKKLSSPVENIPRLCCLRRGIR